MLDASYDYMLLKAEYVYAELAWHGGSLAKNVKISATSQTFRSDATYMNKLYVQKSKVNLLVALGNYKLIPHKYFSSTYSAKCHVYY